MFETCSILSSKDTDQQANFISLDFSVTFITTHEYSGMQQVIYWSL